MLRVLARWHFAPWEYPIAAIALVIGHFLYERTPDGLDR